MDLINESGSNVYNNIKEYLQFRTVKTNEKAVTHVSYKSGKFHIPLEENELFLSLFLKEINGGHKMFLAERVIYGNLFKFYVDIDFSAEFYNILNGINKKFDNEIFFRIINSFNESVKEVLKIDTEVKPIVSTRCMYKIHLNYPDILVNKQKTYNIIDNVINKLNQYEDMGIDWKKTIDTQVYNNGLRIMGSCSMKELKEGEAPYYKVFDLIERTNRDITLEDLIATTVRSETEDVSFHNDETNFTHQEDMDIDDGIISSYVEEIRDKFGNNGLDINQIKKCFNENNTPPCFRVILKDKHCPFVNRTHSRKSYCLYLFITAHGTYLKCFNEECSKLKFPDTIIPLNTTMKNKYYKHIEINKDNEEVLIPEHIILNEKIEEKISMCLTLSHSDIAELVYCIYKDRFRIDSHNSNATWYEFKKHRFHPNSNSLYILLSSDLIYYFLRYKQVNCSNKSEVIDEIVLKLKNVPFKNHVITECRNIFFNNHPDFLEKMDSNLEIICYKNGVLDLNTMSLRDGKTDDCITLSLKHNYIEYDEEDEKVKEIYKFFDEIFPIHEMREYALKRLATCLSGRCDESFNIFSGSGSNGKSCLVNLIKTTFNEYWAELPVALIVKTRSGSGNASPEIIQLKGRRITTIQEPETRDKLNMGIIKVFSGNDNISARQLYKPQESFKLQTKLFLCCNVIPRIDASDGGTWRRIKIIEFRAKFVDNPTKDFERKKDRMLDLKINNWGPAFLSILVHFYKKVKEEGITEPEEVLEFTKEFRNDTDIFAQYIDDTLEDNNKVVTSINDIFNSFASYCTERSIKFLYTKSELKKLLADLYNREKVYIINGIAQKGFLCSFKKKIDDEDECILNDD